MTGPDFIFFLQDSQHRFWKVNSSGSVTLSADPYTLRSSPEGWQEILVKNVRNSKYWGLDRTVSSPFYFVNDGAHILKHIFTNKGPEEPVFLVICELSLYYDPGVEYGFWYKQVSRVEIDLSTYTHDGAKVTAAMLEEGMVKHLKANENTVYEFDLADKEQARLDGIELTAKHNWLMFEDAALTTEAVPALSLLPSEGSGTGFAVFSTSQSSGFGIDDGNLSYMAQAARDTTGINLAFTFSVFTPTPMASYTLELVKFNPTSGVTTTVPIYSSSLPPGVYTDIPVNVTFDMSKNDRLFIRSVGAGVMWKEATVVATVDTRKEVTYCRFYRPQDLFADLIDKVSGGEFTAAECDYFTKHRDKVFTSGDGIRALAGAKLKISFSQFMDFWNTFDEVGLSVTGTEVLLDRKADLVDWADVYDLGEISKPVVKFDKTLPFNELQIGYPDEKKETGMLNGKNEVNTTFTFSLGTTKTPRQLKKISPVGVSCYSIELIRIETDSQDTTATKNDNLPYVLHVEAAAGMGGYYSLNRDYNDHVTGVDKADSVFNLALSPRNCFINSSDYLHSLFYKYESKTLKFIGADRNSAMVYADGVTTIAESADFPIDEMADPFFLPIQLIVDAPLASDLLERLDANPLLVMSFTFEGTEYTGLIEEVTTNPKTNKKQQFVLRSSADNDLTALIDYYG